MEKLSELYEIFPEPKSILEPDAATLEEAVKTGLVVLDTNTLLLPYGVTEDSLEDIKKVYKNLSSEKRLYVPAHVIREFAMNRGSKFSSMLNYFSQIQSQIASKKIQIDRYPFLSTESEYKRVFELAKEIEDKKKDLNSQFSLLLEKIKVFSRNDHVSAVYSEIFSQEIIKDPAISKKDLETDLKRRNEFNIPPGYKDKGKDINAGGDLIVWHTILEIGRTEKKDLVLVSQEGKTDWYYAIAGKPFQPRFELVDEYKRASGGRSFFIISLPEFLKGLQAGPKTIADLEAIHHVQQQLRSNKQKLLLYMMYGF